MFLLLQLSRDNAAECVSWGEEVSVEGEDGRSTQLSLNRLYQIEQLRSLHHHDSSSHPTETFNRGLKTLKHMLRAFEVEGPRLCPKISYIFFHPHYLSCHFESLSLPSSPSSWWWWCWRVITWLSGGGCGVPRGRDLLWGTLLHPSIFMSVARLLLQIYPWTADGQEYHGPLKKTAAVWHLL